MNHQEAESLITEKLAALTSPDDWLRVLTLAQSFNQYSFGNRILIPSQCDNPTYATSFQTWKNTAASSKNGKRRFTFWPPWSKKTPSIPKPFRRWSLALKRPRFFGLGQTDGEPFAVPEATLLTGTSGADLLALLESFAPVPVHWVDPAVLNGANGDYHLEPHVIRVRNDVDPNQQAKTLLHELAHHVGHHVHAPRYSADETASCTR